MLTTWCRFLTHRYGRLPESQEQLLWRRRRRRYVNSHNLVHVQTRLFYFILRNCRQVVILDIFSRNSRATGGAPMVHGVMRHHDRAAYTTPVPTSWHDDHLLAAC
jgi:hypothetical protein